MASTLESRFHEPMLRIYDQAAELGYRPTRFRNMVHQRGGVEAAIYLIESETPSDGFTQLYMLGRLDLSAEALAIRGEFRSLFSDEQLAQAEHRLNQYEGNE